MILILKDKQKNKMIDTKTKKKILNIANFFFHYSSNTPLKRFACLKINSSDILFHSSLIPVLSELIFRW